MTNCLILLKVLLMLNFIVIKCFVRQELGNYKFRLKDYDCPSLLERLCALFAGNIKSTCTPIQSEVPQSDFLNIVLKSWVSLWGDSCYPILKFSEIGRELPVQHDVYSKGRYYFICYVYQNGVGLWSNSRVWLARSINERYKHSIMLNVKVLTSIAIQLLYFACTWCTPNHSVVINTTHVLNH